MEGPNSGSEVSQIRWSVVSVGSFNIMPVLDVEVCLLPGGNPQVY